MKDNFVIRPHGEKPYHTGLAVPIFSLRSENDFGIGQFSDLKILAEFAQKSGMDVIQLLPINDTTCFHNWKDSSPYRAVSVFALHPIYLDFKPFIHEFTAEQAEAFAVEQTALNQLEKIDFEKTLSEKWKYTQILFAKMSSEIFETAEFKDFYEQAKSWLEPYAAYCVLRERFQIKDMPVKTADWGVEFARYSPEVFAGLAADAQAKAEMDLNIFMQYLLHVQFKEAVEHCHELGVAVKGDIAIGVDGNSADAWANPELFNMDKSAGAPPDVFSKTGQNWEFPTYNWAKMAEDDYAWWKLRMQNMAQYFDAYRLDHILGFFRIWEIPNDVVRGLLGQFAPSKGLWDSEIENWYHIPLRQWGVERFTEPFIKDWVVDELFGRDNRDVIIQQFLDYTGDGNYRLKLQVNNQRKIQALTDIEEWQREGLYQLTENVIFIADNNVDYKYQPRIKLMDTLSYRELGDEAKSNLERLYNDYFYGYNYDFWKEQAWEKLPAIIKSTDMLSCGEDLGMVPDNVPDTMYQMEVLRLIIERMPSDGDFVNDLAYTPYLSVVTTSSHDTTPLRLWWEEDPEFTQRYYNEVMNWQGAAPEFAEPAVIQEIVKRTLNTKAMLAIFPIQDWIDMTDNLRIENPADERINEPAAYHYWRYRLAAHQSLEKLRDDEGLTEFYRTTIAQTRRVSTLED